ncbi:phenylacetate--CoA ligase family protein [Tenacibaculum sp. A30]|uniref:phenylacetate--CoA ligase family protein n=1 Tax=Tenacibaculum sp. A30 TaxID=3442644 RepID=UPI003EB9D243
MIKELFFRLGVKYRNPNLVKLYKELIKTDYASLEELKLIQEQKFNSLIDVAFKNSSYLKDKYLDYGVKREDIKSVEDIHKLPILDKEELRKNAENIKTNLQFKKLIKSETSGTTGQPLTFYKNEEWDSMNRAAMYRGYSWYGVNPWDRNGYFWGYNPSFKSILKNSVLDFLQNRFRIFSYNEKGILKFSKKIKKAKYIEGYSSMIYEVAKKINNLKLERPRNIKLIKGTSEKIYDNYHQETIKAFGKKIVSEYGAAEAGLIAFECPEGYMHINSENVIVEEERGEVLVTNLMSLSFPIIRYRLGDKIELAQDDFNCTCGRKHPVILNVLGRVGKNVVGYKNSYPSLTFYYVFKNLALNHDVVLNYQAVQEEKGKVLLKIEQNNIEVENYIKTELQKYFEKDIEFQIMFNSKLHEMEGKLRDFITTLE